MFDLTFSFHFSFKHTHKDKGWNMFLSRLTHRVETLDAISQTEGNEGMGNKLHHSFFETPFDGLWVNYKFVCKLWVSESVRMIYNLQLIFDKFNPTCFWLIVLRSHAYLIHQVDYIHEHKLAGRKQGDMFSPPLPKVGVWKTGTAKLSQITPCTEHLGSKI